MIEKNQKQGTLGQGAHGQLFNDCLRFVDCQDVFHMFLLAKSYMSFHQNHHSLWRFDNCYRKGTNYIRDYGNTPEQVK